VVQNLEERLKVGRRLMKTLRFADDQAMLMRSQGGLQAMMNRLNSVSNE